MNDVRMMSKGLANLDNSDIMNTYRKKLTSFSTTYRYNHKRIIELE